MEEIWRKNGKLQVQLEKDGGSSPKQPDGDLWSVDNASLGNTRHK